MCLVLLILATDLHHLMFRAVVDSYELFRPGQSLPVSDMSNLLATTLAASFRLGLQLAAPLVVFGLVFYGGLGVLARLMPQMPVFFVALPVQLMMGAFHPDGLVAAPSCCGSCAIFGDGMLPLRRRAVSRGRGE
jgi:Flagellar biosynthesis pathway, component FliR